MRELSLYISAVVTKTPIGEMKISLTVNNWPQTPLIFTTNILGNNYKHVFRILSDDRSCRVARW